jgi:hypothetical protein
MLGWLLLFSSAAAAVDREPGNEAETALLLDSRAAVPAWPAVRVLPDPEAQWSLNDVLATPQRFQVPTGTPSNLGRSANVVWLRFAVEVPGALPVQRVLELDYPSLNLIDLYVLREGELVQHMRLGNQQRGTEKVIWLRARTPRR